MTPSERHSELLLALELRNIYGSRARRLLDGPRLDEAGRARYCFALDQFIRQSDRVNRLRKAEREES